MNTVHSYTRSDVYRGVPYTVDLLALDCGSVEVRSIRIGRFPPMTTVKPDLRGESLHEAYLNAMIEVQEFVCASN